MSVVPKTAGLVSPDGMRTPLSPGDIICRPPRPPVVVHRGSNHTHQQGWTLMDACIKQATGQSAPSGQKDPPWWSAPLPVPIRILYSWHLGALYNNCVIELTRPQNMGSLPQLTIYTKPWCNIIPFKRSKQPISSNSVKHLLISAVLWSASFRNTSTVAEPSWTETHSCLALVYATVAGLNSVL